MAGTPNAENDGKIGTTTHYDTLLYIEQMLEQLGDMAKNADQPLLAYMIEMALLEARETRNTETSIRIRTC
ncbi:hypothetical protein HED49_16190 [Ochrobactrum daejeonense]|nr:hypothetical protein [Brucella daejeonensis]